MATRQAATGSDVAVGSLPRHSLPRHGVAARTRTQTPRSSSFSNCSDAHPEKPSIGKICADPANLELLQALLASRVALLALVTKASRFPPTHNDGATSREPGTSAPWLWSQVTLSCKLDR